MSSHRSSALSRCPIPFGLYGLHLSIGFLFGWPFIMFLMAEPLRNHGRSHTKSNTCADGCVPNIASGPTTDIAPMAGDRQPWLSSAPHLIAQMVGAGQLIEHLVRGLPYLWAGVVGRRLWSLISTLAA